MRYFKTNDKVYQVTEHGVELIHECTMELNQPPVAAERTGYEQCSPDSEIINA